MFEFDFHNTGGFLVAFIPGVINLWLIAYILGSLPRNKLVNIFTVFTFCAALWQLDDAVCRIVTTAAVADNWDCILGFGWAFAAPACLHFALLYTRLAGPNVPRLLTAVIYLPAVILLSLFQIHIYPHSLQWLGFWGWVNFHNEHPLDLFTVYWIAFMGLCASVILFYHAYKVRKDNLLRPQAFLIAIGVSMPTITGIVSQLIFLMLDRPSIPITSSFLTLFSLAAVVALKQYRLFSISELINYDLMLDELPVAVLSVSDTGHVIYINQAGIELLHLEKKPPLHLKFHELLQHAFPENGAGLKETLNKALKGIRVNNVESSFAAGDKTITILVSASPVINNKKVRGAMMYIRDITAQTESEHSLQQKNVQLEQSNANLEQFAYVASHDLREPLRKIVTFSGMIADTEKERFSERSKTYFEKITGAAKRMQLMIEDLLSLSVISQNNKFERFSLQTIVDEVVLDLDLKIKEKNASIITENLPVAYINPKQFRQLFLNLINNSLKFSRPEVAPVISIKGKVLTTQEADQLSLPKTGKYLRITLEDNGIGFENVYAEKMFQMFQRLHGRVDYEGTGIGLAICKKIVENHNGTISASGVPGQGATFTIILPFK